MSGPRRRYSEKTANRPGKLDPIRESAAPLGRNNQLIVRDKSLTPDNEQPQDKMRSYIQPGKNRKTVPRSDRCPDKDILERKSRKFDSHEGQGFEENRKEQGYRAQHNGPGPINRVRHSEQISVKKIDERRKSLPMPDAAGRTSKLGIDEQAGRNIQARDAHTSSLPTTRKLVDDTFSGPNPTFAAFVKRHEKEIMRQINAKEDWTAHRDIKSRSLIKLIEKKNR